MEKSVSHTKATHDNVRLGRLLEERHRQHLALLGLELERVPAVDGQRRSVRRLLVLIFDRCHELPMERREGRVIRVLLTLLHFRVI